MWQPQCTKTKTKYKIQKVLRFPIIIVWEILSNLHEIQKVLRFPIIFERSYLICMVLSTNRLYLTTSYPIYRINEYLGSINFYCIKMYLDGVLTLIITGWCYNIHIMILYMQFLLEWSRINNELILAKGFTWTSWMDRTRRIMVSEI